MLNYSVAELRIYIYYNNFYVFSRKNIAYYQGNMLYYNVNDSNYLKCL